MENPRGEFGNSKGKDLGENLQYCGKNLGRIRQNQGMDLGKLK